MLFSLFIMLICNTADKWLSYYFFYSILFIFIFFPQRKMNTHIIVSGRCELVQNLFEITLILFLLLVNPLVWGPVSWGCRIH